MKDSYPIYEATYFLSEVYMDKEEYYKLVQLMEMKKNVILQGPPGKDLQVWVKHLQLNV